jgi:single-stranded DNA-binding protein
MAKINNITLDGNVMEKGLKYFAATVSRKSLLGFTLGVNTGVLKDKNGNTTFKGFYINVRATDKLADEYKEISTGAKVVVSGSLDDGSYKEQSGSEVKALVIDAASIIRIDGSQTKKVVSKTKAPVKKPKSTKVRNKAKKKEPGVKPKK